MLWYDSKVWNGMALKPMAWYGKVAHMLVGLGEQVEKHVAQQPPDGKGQKIPELEVRNAGLVYVSLQQFPEIRGREVNKPFTEDFYS